MSSELDTVLDECLRQIRSGQADIETCLGRYPQYAQELGGLLRTAELLRAGTAPEPRPEAVLRGERRLVDVLAQKRAGRAHNGWDRVSVVRQLGRSVGRLGKLPSWPLGRPLAASAVTVTLLLALGIGAVAASGSSLPGDLLYPVKRATESVRLTLSLSDSGRAGLQMALAERRIQELSEIGSTGQAEQLAMLASEVTEGLKQADLGTRLASSSQSTSKLEASASKQLAALEVSLAEAPDEVKPVVAEALAVAGAEYGAAVEAAAKKSAPPLMAWAGVGTIQVRASDPPPPPVDSVLVVVGKVEAQRVAGGETQWVTIVDKPVSFDLLKIAQVQKLLGSRQVPEGTYTQVRFIITSAKVVAGGQEHAVSVPGEALKLVRPFQVRQGEVTLVVLDFDGSKSLIVTDEGRFKLRPALKLLVPSDVRLADAGRDKRKTASAPQNEPGAALAASSGVKETRVEIEGTVEAVGVSQLVVGGQTVAVDDRTQWKAAPGIGESAEILAVVRPDGSFLAKVIEAQEDAEAGDPDDMDSDDDREGDGEKVATVAPTPTPHLPSPTPGPSLVAGGGGGGEGTAVAPSPTATPRPPSPTPKPRDGDDDRDGERAKTPTPSPTQHAPSPTPTPARSDGGEEDDDKAPSPTPTATPRPVQPSPTAAPTPTPTPSEGQFVEIDGVIQDLSLGQWIIVNGKKVLLNSDTHIEGKLGVGVACEVMAIVREDGTLVAVEVEVEGSEGMAAPVPTPAATPTPLQAAVPTATPTPLPTGTPTPTSIRSGATLYTTYCEGCHGAASNSNVAGKAATETRLAVRTGPGSMPEYGSSIIGSAELDGLASYVAGLP